MAKEVDDESRERISEALESDNRSLAYAIQGGHDGGDSRRDQPEIDEEECALIRCMRGLGMNNSEVSAEVGRSKHSVRRHGTGRCSHDERVPVPPTAFRSSGRGDVVIDRDKTEECRREWRGEGGG